jgi:hypothetical protein
MQPANKNVPTNVHCFPIPLPYPFEMLPSPFRDLQNGAFLRISTDSKAKVKLGPWSRNGWTRILAEAKASELYLM